MRKPTVPHPGSRLDQVAVLPVGGATWIETTQENYASVARTLSAPRRFPDSMKGMKFECRSYTAVGCKIIGDVRYIVRVERVE